MKSKGSKSRNRKADRTNEPTEGTTGVLTHDVALEMDVEVGSLDLNLRHEVAGTCSSSIQVPVDSHVIIDRIKDLEKKILRSECTLKVASENSGLLVAVLNNLRDVMDHRIVIALSKLVWSYPVAERFAVEYFQKNGSPMGKIDGLLEDFGGEPITKRMKKSSSKKERLLSSEDTLCEVLKAVLLLLKKLNAQVYPTWSVTDFVQLKSFKNKRLRWYSVNCIGILLQLSEKDLDILAHAWELLPIENKNYALEFQMEIEVLQNSLAVKMSNGFQDYNGIVELGAGLRSLNGLILKTKQNPNNSRSDCLITLPSLVEVAKDVALLVTNGAAICVVGPVGSGKSTLVRYLASIFGRNSYPDVISVQMSDQVDSRLLLGSYHSTDLPGQFIWRPGCLTKAVLNGHWIVFEDLDSAPMDVISLLAGFNDSKTLSVPGYGEIEIVHPDFRIFATCRTQNTRLERISERIGRSWEKIHLSPHVSQEMQEMIIQMCPHLKPVVDRLVDIFETIMAFLEEKKIDNVSSRPFSLRDFLKFCRRISEDTDFSQVHSAVAIFQEGMDLFVAQLAKPELKDTISELIGTRLNLLKSKTEYYLTMYKPTVNLCLKTNSLICGRFKLPVANVSSLKSGQSEVYSLTKGTCSMLETIAGAIQHKEPVLLVGETGVGKTSSVQYLATVLNQKLIVVNLNRQSDSADLLGGYKPVELKYIFHPLREEFEFLFNETFDKQANAKYIGHIMTCYANKRYQDLVRLMRHVEKSAIKRSHTLRRDDLLTRWTALSRKLSRVESQMFVGEGSPFAFSFIEGTLINAVKNGHWILLDEINLATSEMLQCLSGILDENAQIHLWEKGDDKPIERHPDFHLFAAMNPSTDVGKKDLPLGIRNRFSEVFVAELTDADELRVLVSDYLKQLSLPSKLIDNIVQFYLKIRTISHTVLVDGMGKKPHFSLRTLCRALKIASLNLYGSVNRSLFESFCISFLTQLDFDSHPVVQGLIARYIFGKADVKSLVNQPLPCPQNGRFVKVEGYWIPQGDAEPKVSKKYVLTASVKRNLKDIARIVSAGKLPILIQGETSVGKTSLIQYLAITSGNKCYRINNHQHTDLQEYIGSYQSDANGKLVFTEGVLVQAMRRGEWIILDELNLAPSEVLEALNRLLDDNRQLFITETGITVTAHPRFMLFATQNPPGLYGGRKVLSRAFRNRFVELHFDEIPSNELEQILHLRCAIPTSYCKKIIGVMKDLQLRRKSSAALQGKHGFATLRDLFRWAERYRLSGNQATTFYDWDQHIADEGYLVLAGKERVSDEAGLIQEVLEKNFKKQVDPQNLFSLHENTSLVSKDILESALLADFAEFKHIVWTYQMRRLLVLISKAMQFKEPVLLVGETGCGKTSVVQILSLLRKRNMFSINCHMNSEGSDFLGGLRPVRCHTDETNRLFEWVDGPLVYAMEEGGIFLADEISLADDSVLERINSVLEPERELLIAEKGGDIPRLVIANEEFQFVGTMNPGGDYGKKELSPALRNRLTEIWCPLTSNDKDLIAIIEHNLGQQLKNLSIGKVLTDFTKWLKNNDLGQKCTVSIRDYLSWVNFINQMTQAVKHGTQLCLPQIIEHGASLTFLDSFGTGSTSSENPLSTIEAQKLAKEHLKTLIVLHTTMSLEEDKSLQLLRNPDIISIGPFSITCERTANHFEDGNNFMIESPTTLKNSLRLLRAMQLRKPILLEGSPGVGKTALVTALAKITGKQLTRINLSEQTDISDLFGADLPVEGKEGGHFEWRDGPLLQALKSNSWILLDELNLASQSVLEGLNACLDHRGSVFIPELNRTFKISDSENAEQFSRVYGCQNPVRQGGARKGLPKSFLNRFTQVFMDPLTIEDFHFVVKNSYPTIPSGSILVMSTFAARMQHEVCVKGTFGARGAPWDINLRDLMRWVQVTLDDIKDCVSVDENFSPERFVDLIYGLRMRSTDDRCKVLKLFYSVQEQLDHSRKVDIQSLYWGQSELILSDTSVACGRMILARRNLVEVRNDSLIILQKNLPQLEAIICSLKLGWMPILVGPSGSGKTSLVKFVSQLCGRKLQIMHPSPEMDTIELLGGYEQADIYRRIDEVRVELCEILKGIVKKLILTDGLTETELGKEILNIWSSAKTSRNLSSYGVEEGLGHDEEIKRIRAQVEFLQKAYLKCKSFLKPESLLRNLKIPQNENEGTEHQHNERLERVSKELEQIHTHLKTGIQTGAFQWIDSILIKALVNGNWMLIDGANRCSAAVLDRLNSLMETNGSLLLSERGSIDGKILEIKPHPEFRLILTVDPIYGEISRAMRNRGVEIYMKFDSTESCMDKVVEPTAEVLDGSLGTNEEQEMSIGRTLGWTNGDIQPALCEFGINFFDLDSMLRAAGLKDRVVREEIVNFHRKMRNTVASSSSTAFEDDQLQIFKLLSSTKSIVMQLQQGICFPDAVRRAFLQTYVKPGYLDREDGCTIIDSLVADLKQSGANFIHSSNPMLSVCLPNFINSQLYRVWQHLEVFERGVLFGEQFGQKSSEELSQDFLILSLFSRVVKQDAHTLAIAIGRKYPLKASFATNLANVLDSVYFESLSSSRLQSWDLQEVPSVITKFFCTNERERSAYFLRSLKVSLRLYYQNQIYKNVSWRSPVKGTMGFVAKNITFADGGPLSEFLHCFWALAESFNPILESMLKTSETSYDSTPALRYGGNDHYSELWLRGMKIPLWGKRLREILQMKCSSKVPHEKLIARINLFIQWINDNVLPALNDIGGSTYRTQLSDEIENCLRVSAVGRDRTLLLQNKTFRGMYELHPFLNEQNSSIIQDLMSCINLAWSLDASVPRNQKISLLNTDSTDQSQKKLCGFLRLIFERNALSTGDVASLKLLLRELLQLKDISKSSTEEIDLETSADSTSESVVDLLALKEFLRLHFSKLVLNSKFVSPLLVECYQTLKDSNLGFILKWEDSERFKQLFLKTPIGLVENACLLPLFAGKILLDRQAYSFKVSSLSNNSAKESCHEQLLGILSSELTKANGDRFGYEHLLELCDETYSIFSTWKSAYDSSEPAKTLLNAWIQSVQDIRQDLVAGNLNNNTLRLGTVIAEASSYFMEIASYLPVVDPVVEKEILSEYLEYEISYFEGWLESKRLHQLALNGKDLFDEHSSSSVIHPCIKAVLQDIKLDRAIYSDSKASIVPRPEPPCYNTLVDDIRQFAATIGAYEKTKRLTSIVSSVFENRMEETDVDLQSILIQCTNWLQSHANFTKKVLENFWYWDVTISFLQASVMASRGFNLIADAIRRMNTGESSSVKENSLQLVKFPIPYAIRSLNPSGLFEEMWEYQRAKKRILMSNLLSFGNKVCIQQQVNSDTVIQLHKYCVEFTEWWNVQENEKQRKKDEEDSMYTFKGKEKKMEMTDEEQEKFDLQNNFPSFDNEFEDLQEVTELADTHLKSKKYEKLVDFGMLTDEDVETFLKVHAHVTSFIKNRWLQHKTESAISADFLSPYLNLFEIGCLSFMDEKHINSYEIMDGSEFLVGANVAVFNLSTDQKQLQWNPLTYDFYYDPNVSEAQKLQPILQSLSTRTLELLKEWPDHPALNQIMKIIQRIESFPLDSPIMKFLTGLEMLLGTAQEWESVASQKVTLSVQLAEISSVIINWRKLELRFWKNLSERSTRRECAEARNLWFHLFSTTMEVISQTEIRESQSILELFHRFIESSSVGQFKTRLILLENLHRHLYLLEHHKLVKLPHFLQPYLWNSICYYKQFEDQIASKLVAVKSPIEKKIKDFIKISRWNDANFYALKDSVKKSQRMLNKLISEFKVVLKTTVSSVLMADISSDAVTKTKLKLSKPKKALYVSSVQEMKDFTSSNALVESFSSKHMQKKRLAKLPTLFTKSVKIANKCFEEDESLMREKVVDLDEFTGHIIEKVKELQNLKIPDKGEQRKKVLHNVHNLRRTNLAELFKALQAKNLSYKRGLICIENLKCETKVPYDFLMEPMDLKSGWSNFINKGQPVSADQYVGVAWTGCEEYFQKCISRISVMMKALQNPSKELGLLIVERCRGTVADFFSVIRQQKKEVGSFSRQLWSFKEVFSVECKPEMLYASRENMGRLFNCACEIEYELQQYVLVFESLKDFPLQQQLINSAQLLVSKVQTIKSKIGKFVQCKTKLHSIDRNLLSDCRNVLLEIAAGVRTLSSSLKTRSVLAGKVQTLLSKVESLSSELASLDTTSNGSEVKPKNCLIKLRKNANILLESVLLTFQKLHSTPNLSDEENSIQESDALRKMSCFNFQKVNKAYLKCQNLLHQINYQDRVNFIYILNSLKPLLLQYSKTAQFYLTSFVEFHRESCKLLSVLSSIFTTLAQKGFCLPSDYQEEAMQEGQEMDAKSGMGLGEGETTSDAKDVSDRLESEDQVEDTMKAGETADPADKDINEDEKGIEMREDFDGKQQDKGSEKKAEDDSSSDRSDEEEGDKQMGDVDGEEEDLLDDQMWGGSSDEEDEMRDEKNNDREGVAQGGDPELTPNDSEKNKKDESDMKPNDEEQKEQKQKEYNEMDEGEINDDQTDPYHGDNGPDEEPEALDLPDNLQLDEGDAKDDEGPEETENPFDLDAKEREDFPPLDDANEDKDGNEVDGQKEETFEDNLEDGKEGPDLETDPACPIEETEEKLEDCETEKNVDEVMEEDDNLKETGVEDMEKPVESGLNQESDQAPEPSVNNCETPNANTSLQDEQSNKPKDKSQMQELQEENNGDNNEKSSGQVESEEGAGHDGRQQQHQEKSQLTKSEDEKDATRKPGETDSERSLASEQSTKNRLKTVKEQNEAADDKESEGMDVDDLNQKEAEAYQHIKSAEKNDALTLDNATQEQQEQQRKAQSDEPSDELPKLDETKEEENKDDQSDMDEMDKASLENNQPDLIRGLPQEKKRSKKERGTDDVEDEKMEVDGEKVLTYGVERPADSVFMTQLNLLDSDPSLRDLNISTESNAITIGGANLIDDKSCMGQWHELERNTMSLSQELCEQLRLILEPTQASRLKGDYKTGKRLNMRKVIPYIASGFRKDKIWLRRTQPSKREYQILLALDDSASMSDNQSKQMAFSAVAVVAKALTLLEAGQLAVASFGEDVRLLHPFEEPFTDYSGARLMQQFSFAQRRTRIVQLMEYSSAVFNHSKLTSGGSSSAPGETAQLLLIVSDGRAVCHEGADVVKNAVRKAREQNIFIVFVIVDNPQSQYSILDVQQPVFGTGNTVQFVKYMDNFPFPFYLILRDLSSLPSVLSDALRQWFELVTSSAR